MSELIHYRINSAKIVYEILDGQVIIINFDNGAYFSLDNAGTDMWGLMNQPVSARGIVDSMCQRYAGSREEIGQSVEKLLEELHAEDLIVTAEGFEPGNSVKSQIMPDGERPPFEMPLLTKYEDMKDLLLLDPIHEVDESGWPVSKEGSSAVRKT